MTQSMSHATLPQAQDEPIPSGFIPISDAPYSYRIFGHEWEVYDRRENPIWHIGFVKDEESAKKFAETLNKAIQAERSRCLAACISEMHGATFGEVKKVQAVERKIREGWEAEAEEEASVYANKERYCGTALEVAKRLRKEEERRAKRNG